MRYCVEVQILSELLQLMNVEGWLDLGIHPFSNETKIDLVAFIVERFLFPVNLEFKGAKHFNAIEALASGRSARA